jgi:hypothetical protein
VEILDDSFDLPSDLDPVADLEAHLAIGWEYETEVVIDAPLESVAPCISRVLGTLEPLDARATRLRGSTSNPTWYAQQLAMIPASFQVIKGPELRVATRALGQRLLAAGS